MSSIGPVQQTYIQFFDQVFGTGGDDRLGLNPVESNDPTGNTTFDGRGGNDTFVHFYYVDDTWPTVFIDGGTGIDSITLNFGDRTEAIVHTFTSSGSIGPFTWQNIERFGFNAGSGDDVLTGGDFDDGFSGGGGEDVRRGGGGGDGLYGGGDHDELYGEDGDDGLSGDGGDDLLVGGIGSNNLDGGEGIDTADYSGLVDPLYTSMRVNLATGRTIYNHTGNDSRDTLTGIENVIGSRNVDWIAGDDRVNELHGRGQNDELLGAAGDDKLYGDDGDDTLYGQDDNDTLYGGIGDDTLYGGNGLDTIYGEAGNDTLLGGRGYDILDGGADVDTVSYEQATSRVFIDLSDGTVRFPGELGVETVVDIENVVGSPLADIITGNNRVNSLFGGDGDDEIYGVANGLNDDTDLLDGGKGNDRVYVADDGGHASGGAGNDRVVGGAGDDWLWGGDGTLDSFEDNDTLIGGGGIDELLGEQGDDLLIFGSFDRHLNTNIREVANGGDGIDTMDFTGVTGNVYVNLSDADGLIEVGSPDDPTRGKFVSIENIVGGSGDDTFYGIAATTLLDGGGGADTLESLGEATKLKGGAGDDALRLNVSGSVYDDAMIDGGADNDTLLVGGGVLFSRFSAATASIERINAAVLAGTGSGNVLDFSATFSQAPLRLEGRGGNDTLTGTKSNDTIVGGAGRDVMRGGFGADTFLFEVAKDAGKGGTRDQILDFNRSQGDRIDLRPIDADTDGTAGNQAFKFIGARAFTKVDGQLRFADHVLQGDTNGDGKADFEIAVNGSIAKADLFL